MTAAQATQTATLNCGHKVTCPLYEGQLSIPTWLLPDHPWTCVDCWNRHSYEGARYVVDVVDDVPQRSADAKEASDLTGPARVEAIAAQLGDHDCYGVYVEYIDDEDPAGDVPGRLLDAPGRYAAAMIADDWAAKGFPVVIIFDTTHAPALRKVVDLSTYDDPAHHPHRPFGGDHCARCTVHAGRTKQRALNAAH
jgi:hypothetical protein